VRRAGVLTAFLTAAALAAPAGAQAASLSLAVEGDPTEEIGFTVVASGVSDDDFDSVSGRIKAVGGAGCGPTWATTEGDSFFFDTVRDPGAFTVRKAVERNGPGQYLLCAYLQDSTSDGTAKAAAQLVVTVRSARATLGIGVAPRSPVGPVQLALNGTSELGRAIFARVKPTGGAGCGSSWATDTGSSFVFSSRVEGSFSRPVATSTLGRGFWLVCAWVQEDSGDLGPEAVAQAVFRVTDCGRARRYELQTRRSLRAALRVRARARSRFARRRANALVDKRRAQARNATARRVDECRP
jgi:hypothetical protein